jgi:hypothetical protein
MCGTLILPSGTSFSAILFCYRLRQKKPLPVLPGAIQNVALLCYVFASVLPSVKFYNHYTLVVSASQPRDFEMPYFAVGEMRYFELHLFRPAVRT